MIYIDPPYNTGNDFVYRDKFVIDSGTWAVDSGQIDEETENKLFRNTESNGRFHSDWCSMIYPRLLLARNLLRDDGVIFISIDDNEVENLKKICNEVFGEVNFVCQFVWTTKKAAQGMQTQNMIVPNTEYILVFAKEIYKFKFLGLERTEAGFSNPDNDPRGLWKRQYLQRLGQGLPIRTIIDPATGNTFSFETPYTQEKLNKWIADGTIIFPIDQTKYPARKEFLEEYATRQQLVTYLDLYATKATTEKLYNLFDGDKIFTNPKPDTLIYFLLKTTSNKDDIILDFFSGSATTAHAVMQLNAEDGGNRKFIMVQLPEPCAPDSEAAKAGYKNICEIGKERIRRAGEKVREEAGLNGQNLDIGFRVFKTADSNMKDVYYGAGEYKQEELDLFVSNIKEDRTPLDLLYGCLLELALPLSLPHTEENIDGFTVHIVRPDAASADVAENAALIACFDEDISEKGLSDIAQKKPLRAVFRDSGFADDQSKINVLEIFKCHAPDTQVKVI
jgi:adenine-specific DNA-methyltransferase